jgi:hypothetical protein
MFRFIQPHPFFDMPMHDTLYQPSFPIYQQDPYCARRRSSYQPQPMKHYRRHRQPRQPQTPSHKDLLKLANEAASLIQRAYRKWHQQKRCREQQVRNVFDLHADLVRHQDRLRNVALGSALKFEAGRIVYCAESKRFLEYEDGLIKLMIRADGIESAGDLTIRECRKALVTKIQKLLDELDQLKHEQRIKEEMVEDEQDELMSLHLEDLFEE